MTTPDAPDESPFLPPARPGDRDAPPPGTEPSEDEATTGASTPVDGVPFLPEPPRAETAEPSAPVPFDPRAMVESQRPKVESPVYGQMPVGTDEGRAAARRLREEANRSRRRKRIFGRIAGVVVVAALVVAGFVASRQFRDGQGEREPASPSGLGDEPATVAPTAVDEQSHDADDTDRTGAGSDDDATDDDPATDGDATDHDATDDDLATDDAPSDEGTVATVASAPTTTIAGRSVDVDPVSYYHRTSDSVAGESASTEYVVVHDPASDTYVAEVRTGEESATMIGTDARHRYSVDPGGRLERMRRSATGLAPEPDLALARPIVAADLLPPSALPFAESVSVTVELDGTTYVYRIDIDGWRKTDPEGYGTWVARWNEQGPSTAALVDAGTRQTARDPVDPARWRDDTVPRDDLAELERQVPAGSGVAYRVGADGEVTLATVSDRVADFRSSYAAIAADAIGSPLDLGGHLWADAT